MESVRALKGFQDLQSIYSSRIAHNAEDYANGRMILTLPKAPLPVVLALADSAAQIFRSEPIVLTLRSPLVVVGDLHGQLLDLFRILRRFGMPPAARYLFLGDLVDRGDFSTETLIEVLLLKVLYPEHVFIIRGNHEFRDICANHGFLEELAKMYPVALFDSIIDCFSMMPLAALVDDTIICAHGGIGPSLTGLEAIIRVGRPLISARSSQINELLWSDPLLSAGDGYEANPRGYGCLFSEARLDAFLKSLGRKVLIRGHQCVEEGVREDFGGKCVTVFSASRYCGMKLNSCGVVEIRNGAIAKTVFPMMKYLKRESVMFGVNEVQPLPPEQVKPKFHFVKSPAPGMRDANRNPTWDVIQLAASPRKEIKTPKKIHSVPIDHPFPYV